MSKWSRPVGLVLTAVLMLVPGGRWADTGSAADRADPKDTGKEPAEKGKPEAEPQAPSRLAVLKRDLARKTYQALWRNNRDGLVPFAEPVYRWSCRWLEAERDLSRRKPDQISAFQTHRDRMKELQDITQARVRNKVVSNDEGSAADFYATEAEIWLDQAQGH